MADSNALDRLDEKHRKNEEDRVAAIKHWIEYIKREPADKWGPQLNALVNSQLEAAQNAGFSAEHLKHVETTANELRNARTDSNNDPR